LVYFARYADKNFKQMIEDNNNNKQDDNKENKNSYNNDSINSRLSTSVLEVSLNDVDKEGNKI
jgi:hypothetical protein